MGSFLAFRSLATELDTGSPLEGLPRGLQKEWRSLNLRPSWSPTAKLVCNLYQPWSWHRMIPSYSFQWKGILFLKTTRTHMFGEAHTKSHTNISLPWLLLCELESGKAPENFRVTTFAGSRSLSPRDTVARYVFSGWTWTQKEVKDGPQLITFSPRGRTEGGKAGWRKTKHWFNWVLV